MKEASKLVGLGSLLGERAPNVPEAAVGGSLQVKKSAEVRRKIT